MSCDLVWVKRNNDIPSSFSTSNTRRCFCYCISICITFYDSNKFIDLTLSDDIIWTEICILDIYPSLWYTIVYIVVKCIWSRKISKFLRNSHWSSISLSNRKKFQKLCTSYRTSWRNCRSDIFVSQKSDTWKTFRQSMISHHIQRDTQYFWGFIRAGSISTKYK